MPKAFRLNRSSTFKNQSSNRENRRTNHPNSRRVNLIASQIHPQHSKVQGKLRNLNRLEEERSRLLSQTQPGLSSEQLWDIASSNMLKI